MRKRQLTNERATLVAECETLRAVDGSFADDAARAAFDAKMQRIDAIDGELRSLPTEEPAPAVNAVDAERARTAAVMALCHKHKMPADFLARAISSGDSVDQVRVSVLDELARMGQASETRTAQTITMGEDARDKWIRGAVNWLLVRSGMAAMVAKHEGTTVSAMAPGEFRGMRLLDLAKESLTRAGINTRGMDQMQIAGQAFTRSANYQSTSDFAVILENAVHKVLRASYAVTPDTWSRWCGTATAVDFRPHNWYQLGNLSVLDDMTENGEFKAKAIDDGSKKTTQLATKGNVIGITRKVIVNDDLGFVARLADMLGRAGKLTIEKAVYAKLGENSGLGPTQSDTNPLFHSSRANVGSGSAIGMAGLDADASVLAVQTDVNGVDILDLRPSVLLVPRGQEGAARAINAAQYDPDTTGKLQKPNIVQGMFSDVIGTGRLSGTRRYIFANPSVAPVFVVSFLEGMQEPVIETQDGWKFDGVELKARLDFGVDVIDHRGAVTNAGA